MITVCWKWVRHGGDERWAGTSDADRAALELGLRLAATTADTVTVVSVGDAGAERGLREALAAGARRA
ncbi:MAG: electron transfer flavoprotein subunit beta, partial [Acidimicrobiia bacterium]|nr:electron transfer flavoprotein subunit beta [Acidimicrobiia bacterium]